MKLILKLVQAVQALYAWLAAFAAGVAVTDLLHSTGAVILLGAAVGSWLSTPLQGRIAGWSLGVIGGTQLASTLANPIRPLSFGVASGVLGLLVALGVWKSASGRRLFLAGTVAVALGLYFFSRLVFVQTSVIEAGIVQQRERARIAHFSSAYLSGNAASLATETPERPHGLAERITCAADLTSLTNMGFGCWWCVLAGLLIQAASFMQADRPRIRHAVMAGAVLVVIPLAIGARGLAGEWWTIRADRMAAEGAFEEAVVLYERAQRVDPTVERVPSFCHRLGFVLYETGRSDRAERYVFLGDNFSAHADDETALQLYRTARTLRPDLAVAASRVSDTLVSLGLALFDAGNVDSAIARWEEAALASPERIDVHFLLAHARFVVGHLDQRPAIAENDLLLTRVGDKLVRSDVYNNLGNCYSRQKDLVTARLMYRRSFASFQLVKRVINFNSMWGLEGL